MHLDIGIRVLVAHEMTSLQIPSAPLYALEGVLLAVTLVSALTYTRYYLPYLKAAAATPPSA